MQIRLCGKQLIDWCRQHNVGKDRAVVGGESVHYFGAKRHGRLANVWSVLLPTFLCRSRSAHIAIAFVHGNVVETLTWVVGRPRFALVVAYCIKVMVFERQSS